MSKSDDWPSPRGWFSPVRRGYLMKCCRCGLTHRVHFRLNKTYKHRNIIQMLVEPADGLDKG